MTAFWVILSFVGGTLLGAAAVAAWLSKLRTAAALAEQRAQTAAAERDAVRQEALAERDAARHEINAQRQRMAEAEAARVRAEEQAVAADDRAKQQKATFDAAEATLREAFAALASDSLAKNNRQFLDLAGPRFDALAKDAAGVLEQRKLEITGLLTPFREVLETYRRQLAESEAKREADKLDIHKQLSAVGEAQRALSSETSQLVTALSRPNSRGQWGELQLERVVELAGMQKHVDYDPQMTVGGEENGRQRPDMVVKLPGNRHIVIDAKAPGDSFLKAADEPNPEQRGRLLDAHAKALRDHATQLGRRSYWEQFKPAPDFVVLFVPAESLLYAAADRQPDLIEDALQNKVVLATPTTLVALLKTVELGWRQQRMMDNADEIRDLGTRLHRYLATFAEHFDSMGGQLKKSVDAYNKAVGSFDRNLTSAARRLDELGARSNKDLPEPQDVTVAVRDSKRLAEEAETGATSG